jgi:limonene 1,2-monooxygenase
MPIAVTSIGTPAGVALAGKYGASVLTLTVPRDPSDGPADLKGLWAIAEESAAEHGQTMNRDDWRLTIPVHLAEDRQQALDEARLGGGRFFREYSGESFLRKVGFDGPLESIVDYMVDNGWWIVGTPDDCVEGIKKLGEQSGGFGGFLVQAIDWAPREKILLSFELLARYVMPQFQGSVVSTAASSRWTAERKEVLGSGRTRAIERANKAYAERDR